MKLNTKDLKTALDRLSKIVKARNTLPVLACLKMECNDGLLSLVASSLDEYQREDIECDGEIGDCCVGLAHLQWAIGGEEVELSIEAGKLKVVHQFDETSLSILDSAEFPAWPADKPTKIGVSSTDLANSMRRVVWCCQRVNGVNWVRESVHAIAKGGDLITEAFCGHIFAQMKIKAICAPFEFLVHQDSIGNFADALDRQESTLSIGEKHVLVEHATGAYLSKQIDGKFPDTEPALPKNPAKVGVIKKQPLRDIFNRLKFYASSETGNFDSAKLNFEKDGCKIAFTGSNTGSNGRIEGKFKPAYWAFNIEKFNAVLSNLESDEFLVSQTEDKELGPMVIQDGDMLVLAMPVRMT